MMKSNLPKHCGVRFGLLVVIGRSEDRGKLVAKCDCGSVGSFYSSNITSGRTTSCGCYNDSIRGISSITHGMSKRREYRIWGNMVNRCTNPKNYNFWRYGGAGVEVCDRWRSFENFFNDMGACPPGMSIDRISNSVGYEPGNCRWASAKQQARNRRTNRLVKIKGEVRPLCDWIERFGASKRLVLRMAGEK